MALFFSKKNFFPSILCIIIPSLSSDDTLITHILIILIKCSTPQVTQQQVTSLPNNPFLNSPKATSIIPGLQMTCTESVVSLMRKAHPKIDLSRHSELFEAARLDCVLYERIPLRHHMHPLWNDCIIMGLEEIARRMSSSPSKVAKAELASMLQQTKNLQNEFAQGATIDAQWFVIIGRRPGVSCTTMSTS